MNAELKKRMWTAGVGASLLLGLVFWGGKIGIWGFLTLLSLGMSYELTQMIYTLKDRSKKQGMFLILAGFLSFLNGIFFNNEFELFVLSFLFLFVYFLISAKRHKENHYRCHVQELMSSVFGTVYVVFLPFYFLKIYRFSNGPLWICFFLFILWTNDSMAYWIGKKYGNQKLYPQISPKKTIEGALGGTMAAVVMGFGFKYLFFKNLSCLAVLSMTVSLCLVAQIGDLCESLLKRAFDRKDSGSCLPGHGGLLDRFDSVVFSLPLMYACLKIFSS